MYSVSINFFHTLFLFDQSHLLTGCPYSYSTTGGWKAIFLLTINMIATIIYMNSNNCFSIINFKFWTNFILWIRLYLTGYNIECFPKHFIYFIHINYNTIIFYSNKNGSSIIIKKRYTVSASSCIIRIVIIFSNFSKLSFVCFIIAPLISYNLYFPSQKLIQFLQKRLYISLTSLPKGLFWSFSKSKE